MKITEIILEATGDSRFDAMMGRIQDPVAELTKDEDRYLYDLDEYSEKFMGQFVSKMDSMGINFTADRRPNPPAEPEQPPRSASRAVWQKYNQAFSDYVKDIDANLEINPKFTHAYAKASLSAVKDFIKRKKLDPNNSALVDRVKKDFDHFADQFEPVAGFLGDFMRDFTMFRPSELDVLARSGALKNPRES